MVLSFDRQGRNATARDYNTTETPVQHTATARQSTESDDSHNMKTEQEKAEFVALYHAGTPVEVLCERFGVL